MGGSFGILYYNKELYKYNKKQDIKDELITLSKKKIKTRRDTPYPYEFVQSPTKNRHDRFHILLRTLYDINE